MSYSISYLQSELSKYGLSSTGNVQNDIAELNKIKSSQGESTIDSSSFLNTIKKMEQNQKTEEVKTEASQSVPWASLLQQLGLESTGNAQEDLAKIAQRLNQMKSMNLSPSQKANIDSMYAQYKSYYSQYVDS